MYINPETLFRSNSSLTTMSTHLIYIFCFVLFSTTKQKEREIKVLFPFFYTKCYCLRPNAWDPVTPKRIKNYGPSRPLDAEWYENHTVEIHSRFMLAFVLSLNLWNIFCCPLEEYEFNLVLSHQTFLKILIFRIIKLGIQITFSNYNQLLHSTTTNKMNDLISWLGIPIICVCRQKHSLPTKSISLFPNS